MREIHVGKIYRHFKHIFVEVLGIATHTESKEDLVIYKDRETGQVWARPYDLFTSEVDKAKYPEAKQKYRFEEVP